MEHPQLCEWCKKQGKCLIAPSKEPCDWKKIPRSKEGITEAIGKLESECKEHLKKVQASKDKTEVMRECNLYGDKLKGISHMRETLMKEFDFFLPPDLDVGRGYVKALIKAKQMMR